MKYNNKHSKAVGPPGKAVPSREAVPPRSVITHQSNTIEFMTHFAAFKVIVPLVFVLLLILQVIQA